MLHYPIETLNKLIKEAKEAIYHELCLRLQQSRDWFIPPEPPKYGLGSGDPIKETSKYYMFSGIDTKVVFSDGNGEQRISTAQNVSFEKSASHSLTTKGTMSVLLFDRDPVGELLGKTGRLYIFAAAENSEPWTYFDEQVRFLSFKSAVAVDDLVIEGTYEFEILPKRRNNV